MEHEANDHQPADQSTHRIEYEPNFLFREKTILEANWADWQARGFSPERDISGDDVVGDALEIATEFYGLGNVLVGDAWDDGAQRPLRLKPGATLYVNEAGRESVRRMLSEHE